MNADVRITRVTSLPFQTLNDEALVVDPRTREVHLLNPTATRIWNLLERPQTAEGLSAALAEEYQAPLDTIRAEVRTLLIELSAKGLVGEAMTPEDGPAAADEA